MVEEKTIKEQLEDIALTLKQNKQRKKFKLPFGIKLQKGKIKKDYVLILYVGNNRKVKFNFVKIEDMTVNIKEQWHNASTDNMLYYKKFPLLIIPEWNEKPFSPSEDFEEASKEGTLTFAQKFIFNKMKKDLIKPKRALNNSVIVIGIIVLVAGYFLLDALKVI